ncbi:hypothetical protein Dsin_004477 [Dipteronia sinensis]|uniref:DUF1677 family protein n=1 Tax=Dipteronia sinensis TaxID=43782 RepID=A0AAE0AVI0_9ROSI|nr:hypothetical protein Dsin_004477 [Dipteronia sinensis]
MASGEVVKRAECGCCGIYEECTTDYILWVQQRFGGVWVCGLCEEAIKEEQARQGDGIGVEVALRLQAAFRSETTIRIAPVSILQLIKKIMSSSSNSASSLSKVPLASL